MSKQSLRNACMLGFSFASFALLTPAGATVVFQDNFETAPSVSSAAPLSDSLDADPVAQVGSWVIKDRGPGGGDASEQVTNYAPPGAHGGNNYLRLCNTGDSQARAVLTGPQSGDIAIDSWINTSQFDVRLFTRDAADNIGLFLSWGSGTLRYHNGSSWVSTNLSLVADGWQHLIVKPHLGTSTYDLTLDGNTEVASGYGAISEVSSVLFAAGGSPPMYVDDVSVSLVPEPVGLTGLAFGAMVALRRRR